MLKQLEVVESTIGLLLASVIDVWTATAYEKNICTLVRINRKIDHTIGPLRNMMRKFTIFITCVCFPVICNAQHTLAIVTAPVLNVRTSPDGDIVGTIEKGSPVVVIEIEGVWAKIFWSDKIGAAKEGWASVDHLSKISGAGRGSDFTTPHGASFTLTVSQTGIDCVESLDDAYDSCEVTVSFAYESDYNGMDEPQVSVRCNAELETKDRHGSSGSESEDMYTSSLGREGYGEIQFNFSFYSPVVNATIADVACQIMDVS